MTAYAASWKFGIDWLLSRSGNPIRAVRPEGSKSIRIFINYHNPSIPFFGGRPHGGFARCSNPRSTVPHFSTVIRNDVVSEGIASMARPVSKLPTNTTNPF